ncbi:MAG: tRNA (N6-isopentenyl adenosine(37)-C2)-methylthiotransferase MiaB [Candidatus Margulisiibacteriota bacterium]|jgi:tRNA-2-methylthio-N6-dimethylallyladenosine synthase
MKNKIYIKTFGCQMNTYDTELIQSILLEAGFSLTPTYQDAKIILFNTCSVRENANNKVFGQLHEINHEIKNNEPIFGLLGCMATNFKTELLEDKKAKIDFILGPDNYKELPIIINKLLQAKEKIFSIEEKSENYEDIFPKRIKGPTALIAIMRGCDNFCSYCVVPFTRGRERSRPQESILQEIKKLILDGVKEITLLGQNVNSYQHNNVNFTALIEKISNLPGLERIRFVSPHPKDFSKDLIYLMKERKNICKSLHLPLQSGSNQILKLMNRTYTKEGYLDLITLIKQEIPKIAITTDIIVGFPNETEANFQDTVEVFKKVEFDSAFIFKYSPRKLTAAAKNFQDNVSEASKTERIVFLNSLQKEFSLKKNQAYLNKFYDILIEKKSIRKNTLCFHGRTDSNKLVLINNAILNVGEITPVRITSCSPHMLFG